MLGPALIAGVLTGFIGSFIDFIIGFIPCISCGTCLLCFVWPILSGLAGAFLLSRKGALEKNDGIIVGALCGIFGGLTSVMIGVVLLALKTVFGIGANIIMPAANIKTGLAQAGIATAIMGLVGIPLLIIGSCITLVIWLVFGTLGGFIGSSIFGKK